MKTDTDIFLRLRRRLRGVQLSRSLDVQLGDNPEMCEVDDVSATGFAIFSDAKYTIGQTLQAILYHNGTYVHGTVVVQGYWALGKKNRYGLLAVDDERPNATLKRDLNLINLAVQREQLARLSGNR